MKKTILILLSSLMFSSSLFALDLGWKSVDLKSEGGTVFSLDINLKSYQYALGKAYYTDIWVKVSDYMIDNAKAVVLNYRNGNLVETKEFKLVHNAEKRVYEAPVPYGLNTLTHYNENWFLQPTHQEIAICINDGKWLKTQNTSSSNFYFNIFELFQIQM
ncbi:MAG: hypothetical protein KAQ98_00255 [Bacteriovoracaceae bacterium]|nr:hypothetical protein [Bacteriovoracaceae bacterium]